MAPASSSLDDDTQQLLVQRSRAGLGLVLVAVVVFTLTDPQVHPESFRQLYRLDALEIAVVLVAFWLVGVAATEVQVIAIALVAVSALCCITAVAGVVARDAATTPVLLLVLTLGAATLLPWGIWPQLALQIVATLGDPVERPRGARPRVGGHAARSPCRGGRGGRAVRGRRRRALSSRAARAEKAEAEVRARKHQAELARAARLTTLGGMAAGLAHEINQPLAAIVSYARGCARRLRAGDARPDALLEIIESDRCAGAARGRGAPPHPRLRPAPRAAPRAHRSRQPGARGAALRGGRSPAARASRFASSPRQRRSRSRSTRCRSSR